MSSASERRRHPRLSGADEHGIDGGRIRAGAEVSIVDASTQGALVETLQRLRPNATIDLQISTGNVQVTARGRVVRCLVSRLSASVVWYRGAIEFDRALPWIAARSPNEYALPGAELRPTAWERGPATHERR